MDESYTLSLALVDFIPNIAFLIGAFYLVKTALLVRGSACARMVMAGSLLIATGGILKATWKLLYTLGTADIRLMSELQFVLVAPGFVALLVVAILLARGSRPKEAGRSKAGMLPAIAVWKIPLLIVMTLASLGAQGILTYIAFRRGARLAAAGFIVAFLCLLAMGSLASGEQTVARQWIEQTINSTGQIGFALGSFLLYRNFSAAEGGC